MFSAMDIVHLPRVELIQYMPLPMLAQRYKMRLFTVVLPVLIFIYYLLQAVVVVVVIKLVVVELVVYYNLPSH